MGSFRSLKLVAGTVGFCFVTMSTKAQLLPEDLLAPIDSEVSVTLPQSADLIKPQTVAPAQPAQGEFDGDLQSLVTSYPIRPLQNQINDFMFRRLSQIEEDFRNNKDGMLTKDTTMPALGDTNVMVQYLLRSPTVRHVLDRHPQVAALYPDLEIRNRCHAWRSGDARGLTKPQLGVISVRDETGKLRVQTIGFSVGPGFNTQPEGYVAKTYFGIQKLGLDRGLMRTWISGPTSKKFTEMLRADPPRASISNVDFNEEGTEIYADVSFVGGEDYKITVLRGERDGNSGKHYRINDGPIQSGMDVTLQSPEGPVNLTLMLMGNEIWDGDKPMYSTDKFWWGPNWDAGGRAAGHVSGGVAWDHYAGSHGCFRGGICFNVRLDMAKRGAILESMKKEAPKIRSNLLATMKENFPSESQERLEKYVDLAFIESMGVNDQIEQMQYLQRGPLVGENMTELLTRHVRESDTINLAKAGGSRYPHEEGRRGDRLRGTIHNTLREAAIRDLRASSFYVNYSPMSREELANFYYDKAVYALNSASAELNQYYQYAAHDQYFEQVRQDQIQRAVLAELMKNPEYTRRVDLRNAVLGDLSYQERIKRDNWGLGRNKKAARDAAKYQIAILERQLAGLEAELDAIARPVARRIEQTIRPGVIRNHNDLLAALKAKDSPEAHKSLSKEDLAAEWQEKLAVINSSFPGLSQAAIKQIHRADMYRVAYEREAGTFDEPGRFNDFVMPREHIEYLMDPQTQADFYAAYLRFIEREYSFSGQINRAECLEHIDIIKGHLEAAMSRAGVAPVMSEPTPVDVPHAPVRPKEVPNALSAAPVGV